MHVPPSLTIFEFELLSPDSSAMLCCESVLHVGILHDQTNSFMIRVFDSLFSLIFVIYVALLRLHGWSLFLMMTFNHKFIGVLIG